MLTQSCPAFAQRGRADTQITRHPATTPAPGLALHLLPALPAFRRSVLTAETRLAATAADTDAVQALRTRLLAELGSGMVLCEPAAIAPYCRDWHGDVHSSAVAVLRPASTQEVAQCVRACAQLGLGIVPQGGNTGLVLGATPDAPQAQVLLSLERMQAVREIDADGFSAVVEAGCILSVFKDAVAQHGLYFPLALGAQGSCRIGGNISTNAGGINVLRYGMARDLVLGLEVVLADGTVLNLLRTLRKDNRGIDLKQLFIGAEGTLGIVTAVAVKLFAQPQQVATALVGLASVGDAIALYRLARRQCCDLMSAFELMPPLAFRLAIEAQPSLIMPIDANHNAYVLLELSGGGLVDVQALLERFLEEVMESGLVRDGVVAASAQQAALLWQFREGMNEGQARRGLHLRTDVSVPLSRMAAFVAEVEQQLQAALPGCTVISYGHIGDGNVHVNMLPPAQAPRELRLALIETGKTIVNACVDRYQGSISAEHGIGRLKRKDFEARLPPAQRALLTGLRQLFDPQGLLNPGCMFASEPVDAGERA